MAEFEKYSNYNDIEKLLKHYARQNKSGVYHNKEIDTSRIKDDYNLAPDRGTYKEVLQYLKDKVQEISPRQRKDGVKMCTWVVTRPVSIAKEKEKDFFEATYSFLVERYGSKSGIGEDVVLSAYVHRSETQPHLHFSFLPVLERKGEKSFCAKSLIDRQELKSFHGDLETYLVERGICKKGDINSGITKAQGGNRSVRQFKRETARDRSDRMNTIKANRELQERENAVVKREEALRVKETHSRWDSNRSNNERGDSRWDH